MMIRILISFLLISLLSVSFSQVDSINADKNFEQSCFTGGDEIDLKELVQQQVEASKQKQLNDFMSASLHEIISVEGKEGNTFDGTTLNSAIVFGVADLSVVIFLIAVAISVFVIVINRLRNRKSKVKDDSMPVFSVDLLKKNIAMIRNEDPVLNRTESYLSDKRKNLKNVPLNNLKKDISATAKKLQLSKGEILLSSNIKNFEREKTWNKMKGLKKTNRFAGI